MLDDVMTAPITRRIAAGAVVALLVVGVSAAIGWSSAGGRSSSRPPSSGTGSNSDQPPAGILPGSGAAPGTHQPHARSAGKQVGPTAASASGPTAGRATHSATLAPATATTTPRQAQTSQQLPSPGSYSYATSGYEQLSISGTRRDFPPQTSIDVARTGCGESDTWTPSSQHSETVDVCPVAGGLHVVSDTATISFYGRATTQTFTCSDKSFIPVTTGSPGETWKFTCSGSGTTASETVTYEGVEDVTVGGALVRTVHVRLGETISGAESGTGQTDYWFTSDATVAKQVSTVSATRNTAFGPVTYTSSYTLELKSLRP
jgi:hypothetical protein